MASRLYHWYLENIGEYEEEKWIAHGIVTGHIRLADSTSIHTSKIKHVSFKDNGQVLIQTKNTLYYCHMKDADYEELEKFQTEQGIMLPDFRKWKEKYAGEKDG